MSKLAGVYPGTCPTEDAGGSDVAPPPPARVDIDSQMQLCETEESPALSVAESVKAKIAGNVQLQIFPDISLAGAPSEHCIGLVLRQM